MLSRNAPGYLEKLLFVCGLLQALHSHIDTSVCMLHAGHGQDRHVGGMVECISKWPSLIPVFFDLRAAISYRDRRRCLVVSALKKLGNGLTTAHLQGFVDLQG